MLLFRIETALSFECGSIILIYNLSYSFEKYNKTSVKIRSFRMKIFTYIYVLEEALYFQRTKEKTSTRRCPFVLE